MPGYRCIRPQIRPCQPGARGVKRTGDKAVGGGKQAGSGLTITGKTGSGKGILLVSEAQGAPNREIRSTPSDKPQIEDQQWTSTSSFDWLA